MNFENLASAMIMAIAVVDDVRKSNRTPMDISLRLSAVAGILIAVKEAAEEAREEVKKK